MKQKLPLFLLLLLSAVLSRAEERSIMVMSDIHVLDNSLWDKNNPSIFYSDPKMVEHSAELFDMAVDRVLAVHPQLLLITGDLTYNGEKKSHEYVASQLAKIQAAGTQVFVIPGNHDVSSPIAKDYSSGKGVLTENLSAEGFAQIYADYGYNDAVKRLDNESDSLSYMVYVAEDMAIIGLNTNQSNIGGHKSAGEITQGALDFLRECTAKAMTDGRTNIIVMAHHPIMEHVDNQSRVDVSHISNMSKGMISLSEIQEQLTVSHVHAVFTGHAHLHTIARVPTANGDLYDISTGSLCSFPSPMRHVTMDVGTGDLSITSEMITAYQQEGYERDTVLAKAAVNAAVERIYPKFTELREMIDKDPMMKVMFSGGVFENVDKESLKTIVWLYMGKEIHHAFTSISRGDENANVYFDTDSAYNAAVTTSYDMLKAFIGMDVSLALPLLQPVLAKKGINIDSSIMPENIFGSVYYNYVTINEQQVTTSDASCTTMRQINVREGTISAVDDVYEDVWQGEKRLEDGRIVIYVNGRRMSILGQTY